MIKSGTPQGFQFAIKKSKRVREKKIKQKTLLGGTFDNDENKYCMDLDIKAKSPAITGLGVDDTVYMITQDINLSYGIWSSIGVHLNPLFAHGEVIKHLRQHSTKSISQEEAVLRNMVEFMHLISRDSGHIINIEVAKYPPLMKVAYEIATLLSHSNSTFYHYVIRHTTANPIKTKLIYFR